MNEFTFTYPTKVYFGEGVAKKVLSLHWEEAA